MTSDLSNDTLADFLQQPRPEWSKVRWINVQGLSWDVIQMLAVAYDLHPLSVEDIVHIPQRIKADYFQVNRRKRFGPGKRHWRSLDILMAQLIVDTMQV